MFVCDGASPLRPSPPQELRSRWTPSFFNASLPFFSRGQLYSMAILHVAREFTVVVEPICDKLYIEVNAYVITK